MPRLQHIVFLLVFSAASVSIAEQRSDRIVADFEANSYGKWRATGDAFGSAPATGTLNGQQPVLGFKGDRLVNTSRGGDGATGTLTSPMLTIDRKFLRFLIGGGRHDQTSLQLLIDGEVVASQSGRNVEQLSPNYFDLSQHQGKHARLRIVDNERGRWGHINVDHIVLSDIKPQIPAYRSRQREFTVAKHYLVLPIQNGAKKTEVELKVEGVPVRRYDVELAMDSESVDFYAYFIINSYLGKDAKFSAKDATEEGFSLVRQADEVPGFEDLYDEKLRPQLRFSQKVGWNNDPNGMVYLDGQWNLYFQHNPVGRKWGNMTWGHAVSGDLVHWEQLPNVLFPHTMAEGACFSGGATIDRRNTAGWKTGDNNVLVAFFTDTQLGECVAYSNDRGRTFTLYEGNPIIEHQGRDPKVIWYDYDEGDMPLDDEAKHLGGHWVLFVYNEAPGLKRNTSFHASTNLKDWTLQSRLLGYYECPELFELPIDGDAEQTRWVTFAADARYAIGDFDGRTFTPDHAGKYRLHYGAYYASQTFENAPDGRRIQIGWAQIPMPGMPFNQTFSFPHELSLRTTSEGIRMHAEPIAEIETLHTVRHAAESQPITPDRPAVLHVSGQAFEVRATFEVNTAKRLGVDIGGNVVAYDTAAGELNNAEMASVDSQIKLRILIDRPIMEICGNDGAVFITSERSNKENIRSIKAFADGGAARLVQFEVYEMESIWRQSR